MGTGGKRGSYVYSGKVFIGRVTIGRVTVPIQHVPQVISRSFNCGSLASMGNMGGSPAWKGLCILNRQMKINTRLILKM